MATRVPIKATEQEVDMHFPAAGIDLASAFHAQPPRQILQGTWARTTPVGQNVRGFDPADQRLRGGSRPGLSKYIPAATVAGWVVQEIGVLVGVGFKAPGGHVQQSNSGRVVTLVAVQQGNIYVANSGDTTWTAAVNSTSPLASPPLNFTGVLYQTSLNQKMWFADGVNWCYYDPSVNTVFTWAASAGTLPLDSANNAPRLICTWRGRLVLSGLLLDPQNWFMSAVGDPTNWNYAPASVTPTQAIAGNNAPMGLIGDVVTGLIPYSDDTLIFLGDHTVYRMDGDPMSGGQISLVSDAIGGAWGQAWCKDPYGNVYFLSNRTGVYQFNPATPGNQPQRISQAVEQLLLPIDTGANAVRLIWNDRFQGLHIFVSPLAAPGTTTHFFWEQRTGAWWTDVFGSTNYDPLTCCTFDGNQPGDRVALIGSWDGYVRAIDPNATTDDGTAINSSVVLGPILNAELDDMMLSAVQAVLGESAGSVTYSVYVGASAQAALSSTPVLTGTWTAGRNLSNLVRRAAHAIYVRIDSTNPFQLEEIRCTIAAQGRVRRRGR